MFHSKMIRQFEVFLQSLPSRVQVTPASEVYHVGPDLSVPWQSCDSLQQRNINTLAQRKSADSSCNLSTVFSDDDVCICLRPVDRTRIPSSIHCHLGRLSHSGLCVGCEAVEYGTMTFHQMEEAQMSMCCRIHLDMAWSHFFSLGISHPTIPRDVSTTATSMRSPEAQFRFVLKIQPQYLEICSSSVLIARSAGFALTVMSRCSFQHHRLRKKLLQPCAIGQSRGFPITTQSNTTSEELLNEAFAALNQVIRDSLSSGGHSLHVPSVHVQ